MNPTRTTGPVHAPSLPVEPSPAEVHPKAPAGVRDALAGLPVDVADVLAGVAELAARELFSLGWDPSRGTAGAAHDALELLGARAETDRILDRPPTSAELAALEAAIRWHLDHPAG